MFRKVLILALIGTAAQLAFFPGKANAQYKLWWTNCSAGSPGWTRFGLDESSYGVNNYDVNQMLALAQRLNQGEKNGGSSQRYAVGTLASPPATSAANFCQGSGSAPGPTNPGGGGTNPGNPIFPQQCWYIVGTFEAVYGGPFATYAWNHALALQRKGYTVYRIEDRCGGGGFRTLPQPPQQQLVTVYAVLYRIPYVPGSVLRPKDWTVYQGQIANNLRPFLCTSAQAQERYWEVWYMLRRNGVNPQGNIVIKSLQEPRGFAGCY